MSNDVRKVTDVIVGSEELGEKLQKIETVDELIKFYQSIDDSLTEDDILNYICEEIGIDDLENVDDLVLENVSGGKVDPKNKILSTALGALTAVSAIGAAPSVGAKDNNSSKTSVGQKIKGGFTKAGQAIKDKWNGLTKKQKIALVAGTTVAVAGAATIGGVLYHKHHKDKQDQKPADTVKPTVKLTDGNKKGDGPRKLAEIWGSKKKENEFSYLDNLKTDDVSKYPDKLPDKESAEYKDLKARAEKSAGDRRSVRLDNLGEKVATYVKGDSNDAYKVKESYDRLKENYDEGKISRNDFNRFVSEIDNKIDEVNKHKQEQQNRGIFNRGVHWFVGPSALNPDGFVSPSDNKK